MLRVLDHQIQKPSCQTTFSVCSTHRKGSSYQIIRQKGDCNGSKQAIEAQEQARPLGASRGEFLELRLYLSPFVDRRRGHGQCQVRCPQRGYTQEAVTVRQLWLGKETGKIKGRFRKNEISISVLQIAFFE